MPADDQTWTAQVTNTLPGTSGLSYDASLILNAIPGAVYALDREGRATLVNDAATRLLGWTAADLLGRRLHDVIHHTRSDGTPYPHEECPVYRSLRDGELRRSESDLYWAKDGKGIPIELECHPIRIEGELTGALVTFHDITERRRAEERTSQLVREQFARAKAEFQYAQLRDVLSQVPALICVTRGPRHVIDSVNEQFVRATGLTDLPEKTMAEVFAGREDRVAVLDRAYETGDAITAQEATHVLFEPAGAEERYYDYVIQPLRDEGGTVYGLLLHAVEVTDKVHARHALVMQNRLARLVAGIGLVLTRSDSLEEMLQDCAETVVEYLDAAVARVWTLNEREQVLELQASAGQYTHLDGPHGRVPLGHLAIGLIAQDGKPHLTNSVVGDPGIADQEWVRREGMISFAGYPLMIGNRVVGVLAMFAKRLLAEADVQTLGAVAYAIAIGIERKRSEEALRVSEQDLRHRAAELARLAGALERSNRELDAFAYAASHDLRAPLRGIANLAQWIEEDLKDTLTEDTREMLALMRTRMHRMEGLIEGLLEYSRAGRMHHRAEPVNTVRLVQDVIDLLSPGDTTEILVAPDLPTIHTEKLPLQQVFLNLIGNALKHARAADSRIGVTVRDEGTFWEFAVQDNGPGIDPEFQDRIWGIFQTLEARDKVEGTGIGLALVKKLVEAQGGRAWVESRPGAGATFKFLWRKSPA